MTVDPSTALSHPDGGTTYYFCSAHCRDKFAANPSRFVDATVHETPAPATAAPGTIWTCPMHPEIRRDAPDACPICGMALELLAPTAEEAPNEELADMTRPFWISVALTAPLVWPMVGELFTAISPMRLLGHTMVAWAELVLATPVVLWGGAPFFVRGWQSVVNRSLNMFTLIALGTGAAWLFSVGRRR